MKRRYFIREVGAVVIAMFLVMPLFPAKLSAGENNNEGMRLVYKIPFSEPILKEVEIQGKNFTRILMYDCICIGDVGSPELPIKAVKILLPYGTELKSVDVHGNSIEINYRGVDLKNKPIFPYQPPMPINELLEIKEAPPLSINEDVYNSENKIPSKLYDSLGVDYCRGYSILTLNLYPVEYIPKEGRLFYYPELTIEVSLENTGYVNRFFRNNPDDKAWVQALVINPEVADTYIGRATFEYPGGICDPSEDYDYVIITRQSLASFQATYNWTDLINRRQAQGLTATLVTVEDILACPDYWNSTPLFNDTPAKIREFCRDAYIDWGTQYILIGGDDDGPAAIERREMKYAYESNVDSDLYWSNLDKTFNDDGDNYWGEEGDTGFDLYSELFIGSITCDEGIDVSNWLTKCFYYEDAFDRDYLENLASYAGDTGWSCEGDDFMDFTLWGTDHWLGPQGSSESWPSWLGFLYGFDTWNTENPGMEFNTTQLHTAEPPNPGWMGDGTSGMRDAINNDLCTLIFAVAHANEHMSMDVYDTDWEANYYNTKPFFVHDYGCHCGDMDAADDGVLHAMLFHSDTELAFACVYNTCYGWGNLYSTNSSSALQQKLFVDFMLNTSKSGGPMNWQLGRIQAYTKDALAPTIDWDPYYGTWRAIIEGCLLFGDPALTLKPPVLPEHNVGVKSLKVKDHVNPGQLVYVNASIVNTGRNNETNVIVSFRINGSEVENITIPFFQSQTSVDVSFNWTPAKGWYVVAINVTIPGVVENITYDNEKSRIVIAGPDVAVSSMEAPSFAPLNSMRSVKATIVNLGASDEIVNVYLKVNGSVVDMLPIFLPAGKTEQITMLWNPTYEGTYPIEVEVSVEGEVYLGNNYKSQDVSVVMLQGYVLLVDDDKGKNYETYFEDAITAAGYVYEYWDRSSQGCPSPEYMGAHAAVVWFTGDDSSTTLLPEDQAALATYLDNGGRLFITGQDIGYDIHNDPFYTNYLHAVYGTDDTNEFYLDGIPGDPIGDNLTICIQGGDGASNQYWPSGIYPTSDATPVFQYQTMSYYGGIKYEGTYKVVYFSFGFEAINNIGDRVEIMGRILNWLGGGGAIALPDIYLDPMNLGYVTWQGKTINDVFTLGNNGNDTLQFEISLPHGFTLQWTHTHGGYGHSELAQPVGDIDEDGVNEFLIGGYGSGGTYIYSYDSQQETYVQEYFWTYPGGWYNVPSGACVVDLDDDGDLEFVVSWEYSGQDGIHAYDWDGTTLTELDWYTGVGYDFAYDVYACDYDDDGDVEVLIANDPPSGYGYHVTALAWNNTTNKFEREISWSSGQSTECPMVWHGDTDGDGKTEVIACAGYSTVYALNYENGTWVADIVASGLPAHPYGVACGDLDGDGLDEIGLGLDSTDAYIYKWNFSTASYEQVWHYNFAGEENIIEGIAIGDADNDGQLEFLVGPENVHIIKWDGSQYEEVYTIWETDGMLSSVLTGDFDTDGYNEVKACDIITGPGKEWIFDYLPEPTWINISPRNGTILPGEEINVTISIDTTNLTVGLTSVFLQIETNDMDEANIEMPVYISIPSFVAVNIPLHAGWNMITVPLTHEYNASSLFASLPGCSVILRWNASEQQFEIYVPSCPYDFGIRYGEGYLVAMKNDYNFTVLGIPIESVEIPLYIGWNFLGWFKNTTYASSIFQNITACNLLMRWNNSLNNFDVYIPGAPDFKIRQGEGFFVAVDEESIWHGEG